MANLYKLTDSCGKMRNGTQWGPGISHSGTGEGGLCGPGWIHAYEHPLIAVLLNPIHADFKNPRLWEAEGEVGLRDGQLKCGCKTLTTVREIPLPAITTEMRVRFAILCAKEVCADLSWNAWADKWLSGGDRTQAAAEASATRARAAATRARPPATRARAYERAEAAWASAAWASASASASAAWASATRARAAAAWASAAASAAWASASASAAWAAAWAEVVHGIDIFEIAEKACSGLRNSRLTFQQE